jgi:hypothetical protein
VPVKPRLGDGILAAALLFLPMILVLSEANRDRIRFFKIG